MEEPSKQRRPRLPWGTDESSRPRELSVETLRGVAIVLMVAGHVIGSSGHLGMNVAADSGYRYFVDALAFLRMPLFTVISGYVYDMRPAQPGRVPKFLAGKARRLLLPFVTIASLQYLAKSVAPGVNSGVELRDMWRIYLFPFDQFWFLQALTLIFFVVAWLDGRGVMHTLSGYAGVFAVALGLHLWMPVFTTLFALPQTLYLLPYFLLGVGMHRFAAVFGRPALTRAAACAFAVAFAAHQAALLGVWDRHLQAHSPVALIIGTCGCILLFRARVAVTWLGWLGSYAYTIYLLHVFPTAGSRIALLRLGLDHHALIFAIGLAAGLLVPIAADRVLRKHAWTRLLFLGLSPRQPAPSPSTGDTGGGRAPTRAPASASTA